MLSSLHPMSPRRLLVTCIVLAQVTTISLAMAISGDPDDGNPADSPHPDTLPLAFTVGQDRVVLNLTRTAVVTDQIPIYLGDDSGTIQPWSDDQNETFLVFTDDVTMATFILRETTDPEGQMSRQLRGTFDNEGELYSLEPFEVASSRMKRALEDPAVDDADSLDEEVMTTDIDDVTYTVSRLNRTKLLDMQHDAVIRDDIEAINREQERILSDIGNDPSYSGRIPYEVELFLVLDYSVYRSWLEYSRYSEADAISNMRFYFIHILSGVNARYRGIRESDMEIYLDPVGIYIARTPGASAFTEYPPIKQGTRYTEAYDALDAFEEWINVKVKELPPFDQATLFTKNYLFRGLRSDGSRRRINGVADIKGVCRYKRASINYDSGPYGSVQTAAHELGHNLGAYHDGDDNNCVSRDQFIMATSPGALTDTTRMNPFHFSHCSIRAFRDYFYFLRVNKTNCLRHNAHTGNIYDYEYNLRTQPGQQFDVHAQCKLLFGSSSYYCGGGRYDTMLCQEMRCWDANLRQCLRSVEQRAAEGTTCGNYMWCSNGECVHDRSAPSTETETCIYGDYRGVVDPQTKWTCEDVKRYAPWRCYDEDLGLDCCASCSELRDTQRTGCEFGDKDPDYCRTLPVSECYSERTSDTCCEKCAQAAIGNEAGCQYGDKASWCATSRPKCYDESDICCKTCKAYETGNEDCLYGDRWSWCSGIDRDQCYDPQYQTPCCATCARHATGTQGCEYGDRSRYCTRDDCSDARRRDDCCDTCRDFIVSPGGAPCSGGDDYNWCSYRTPSECYSLADSCCGTCSAFFTGTSGCEYGNRASWCESYIRREGPGVCERDSNVAHLCCLTCQSSPQTPSGDGCMDQASWCSTINSGQCYDATTRDTCCVTCRGLRTNDSGCEYGDKFSWCARQYCSTNQRDCCSSCR